MSNEFNMLTLELLANICMMGMCRFQAKGQLLNVIEVTENSPGTYHCVVVDKNDEVDSADIKLGKFYH